MSHHFSKDSKKQPYSVLIFGLTITILGIFFSAINWHILRTMPTRPELLDITKINESLNSRKELSLWASLQNSQWNCASIQYIPNRWEDHTQIIATDSSEKFIVLVEFSHTLSCDEIVRNDPTGTISILTGERYKQFMQSEAFGFVKYKNLAQYFELCAYCGRGNTEMGVIVGLILVIGGLAWYPLSLRTRSK